MRENYAAAIGQKNRNYYLSKFEAFDQKGGGGLKPSWNWSALIFTGAWALYRKMYGWFFAWFGIVFISGMADMGGSPVISGLIFLVSSVVFASYANALYYNKVRTKIAVAQLNFKDESKLLENLSSIGGIHKWVTWVFGGIPIIAISAALVIPMVANKSSSPSTDNYSNGEGVPKNDVAAIKRYWYRLAAAQGDADAQSKLGLIYSTGQGVVQDYAEAVKWYRLAAAQGLAQAQVNLGLMYDIGLGVIQDYAEAGKWYRLAAAQGDAYAQFRTGVMYGNGQGVVQDYPEAVKWYRLAAAQGLAQAQVNLGAMYGNGEGVIQDYVRAHMWANLAASQGNKIAAENRELNAKTMTPQQIGEAEKLARECQARNYKGC